MNAIKFLFVALCFSLVSQLVISQNKSLRIEIDKLFLDGNNKEFKNVLPGDTLLILAGSRDYLLIKNFKGRPGKPIVIINSGGEVTIDTDHYFGISIQNCQFLKLTGTGVIGETYGFQIKSVANGSGIGVGYLSSDFEIDHISIENCLTAGLYAKTDPDCSLTSVRGTFTQYNTSIHDNYISNVGNEGLYIGSTKYSGQIVQCNGKDTMLLPSLLEGVRVYNNIIKYSGWDGIQVSSASKDCNIFNNTVLFDSQDEHASQMSGIIIGGGSKCDCYNNFISQGKGDGIESHGLGGYRIFNNIILDAGRNFYPADFTQMKHGIFVTDISVQKDSSFYILHNDIINPKSDGIRFSSMNSKKNVIASNVIINPGNFDYYENGNTSFKGSDSYIMFQNIASEAIIQNNYFARNSSMAGFLSPKEKMPDDFKLLSNSLLINAADPYSKVAFDYDGSPRPYGQRSDIGAFEYNQMNSNSPELTYPATLCRLMVNPASDLLKIYLLNEPNQIITLDVYNSNGQLIKHFGESDLRIENQIIRASLANILPGFYFYSIYIGNSSKSEKFLKN
jgi:hypothetical protein